VRLLCLLLLALPSAAAPHVRWIDEKGDVHLVEAKEILEESPSEVRVRLPDGAERTILVARVIDVVRESDEREEESALLAARRDVAFGLRPDAARKTLDRLARDGSLPWVREYAAATRAILAERTREEDAGARLQRFVEEYPRSRFQSDAVLAQARVRGRAHGKNVAKGTNELRAAHDRIIELAGPLALRFRTLRDGTEIAIEYEPINYTYFFGSAHESLARDLGQDYGAYVLLEAEAKWAMLLVQQLYAKEEEAKGRPPFAARDEVKKLVLRASLDLPEVRSDLERELGRLLLLCGDKEGARGAWERARDLAPDALRREAAEEALKKLVP
jgi:hypothetical protein